eukprot:gene17117-6973_t
MRVPEDKITTNAHPLQIGDVELVTSRKIVKTRKELEDLRDERRLVLCKFVLEASARIGCTDNMFDFKQRIIAFTKRMTRDKPRKPTMDVPIMQRKGSARRAGSMMNMSRKVSAVGKMAMGMGGMDSSALFGGQR